MFDKLLETFGLGGIHKIGMITAITSQIVATFEKEFAENKVAKNAAIDTVIELLQKHKEAV